MRSVESYHYAAALSTERHLFSHCHYIYCDSQNDDKSQSEKQIDIESLPLDEIAEAIASLPMILKIHWRKRSIPTHSEWLYPLTFDAGKGLKEA